MFLWVWINEIMMWLRLHFAWVRPGRIYALKFMYTCVHLCSLYTIGSSEIYTEWFYLSAILIRALTPITRNVYYAYFVHVYFAWGRNHHQNETASKKITQPTGDILDEYSLCTCLMQVSLKDRTLILSNSMLGNGLLSKWPPMSRGFIRLFTRGMVKALSYYEAKTPL